MGFNVDRWWLYFDINVGAVWGSMLTGGGCSSTNESLGTVAVPGLSEKSYSKLEEEIGDWWLKVLEEDMKKTGEEEKNLTIAFYPVCHANCNFFYVKC